LNSLFSEFGTDFKLSLYTIVHICRFQELHKPAAANSVVYHSSVESLVQLFSAGYNSSLIVTGYKGSGKSYTVTGNVDNVGIIPFTLQQIFRKICHNGMFLCV